MDEKKEEKQKKSKSTESTPDPDKGVQSETESLIEQSNKAAERNEKVLAELKKENDRTEKLKVQEQLAGKGQAGQPQQTPQITPEQKAANERIKAVGDATGAQWAKNMEKKDDAKI